MALPGSNKTEGDAGHIADHNAIVTEVATKETPAGAQAKVNAAVAAIDFPVDSVNGRTGAVTGLVDSTDPRLSDQRVPTDGSVTLAKLSATGTKDATTVLHGDNVFRAPAGGGGSATTDASLLTSGTLSPDRLAASSIPIDRLNIDIATQAEMDAANTASRLRSNHVGTQTASTISDFNLTTRAQVEAALVPGNNVTITPAGTGATRTLTLAVPTLSDASTSYAFDGGGPSTTYAASDHFDGGTP